MKLIESFARALSWVEKHTVKGGIAVSSKELRPYPEVSGYFIPTLLAWKEDSKAHEYGRWLLSSQLDSGAWTDPSGTVTCIFDVGQIVRGLLAMAQQTQGECWKIAISRAVTWCTSFIDGTGAIDPPDKKIWGGAVPLGVLLYSLEPLRRAAVYLEDRAALAKIDNCISWFLADTKLTEFTALSHFHAYIMEALVDLGHEDRCRDGMCYVASLQRQNGAVPAYSNVSWVCSSGLFQYAIVWYKLGENELAHKAFHHAVSLQNRSGGWYGSYGGLTRIMPDRFGLGRYFARQEISWTVKYFMDALQLMLRARFEEMAHIFPENISPDDGRFQFVRELASQPGVLDVLDAGCGKGRYLKLLAEYLPHLKLFATDISTMVMEKLPVYIQKDQGSLLALPYDDASFDMVYTCESLEHAVHLDGALRELARIVRPGGMLCIIDKNISQLGRIRICEWEQWFGVEDLRSRLQRLGFAVNVRTNISYEGRADGLFAAWVAVKQ